MQPTRARPLLAAAAASAALAWLVVSATFANLPPMPWTAVPALALLAIAEGLTGRNLRARLRGPRPIQPLAVPRFVALAKASSATAAVIGGLAVGLAIYALGGLDKPVPRHDAIVAAATVAAAVALVAAALYLERSCRAPDPPEADRLPSANGQRQGRNP